MIETPLELVNLHVRERSSRALLAKLMRICRVVGDVCDHLLAEPAVMQLLVLRQRARRGLDLRVPVPVWVLVLVLVELCSNLRVVRARIRVQLAAVRILVVVLIFVFIFIFVSIFSLIVVLFGFRFRFRFRSSQLANVPRCLSCTVPRVGWPRPQLGLSMSRFARRVPAVGVAVRTVDAWLVGVLLGQAARAGSSMGRCSCGQLLLPLASTLNQRVARQLLAPAKRVDIDTVVDVERAERVAEGLAEMVAKTRGPREKRAQLAERPLVPMLLLLLLLLALLARRARRRHRRHSDGPEEARKSERQSERNRKRKRERVWPLLVASSVRRGRKLEPKVGLFWAWSCMQLGRLARGLLAVLAGAR